MSRILVPWKPRSAKRAAAALRRRSLVARALAGVTNRRLKQVFDPRKPVVHAAAAAAARRSCRRAARPSGATRDAHRVCRAPGRLLRDGPCGVLADPCKAQSLARSTPLGTRVARPREMDEAMDEEMPQRSRRPFVPFRHLVLGVLGLALALLGRQEGKAQAPPTETLVFPAVADTYVDATLPTTNFNTDGHLKADASPERISYLRFTVAGLNRRPVVQARVRLQVNSTLADSGGTIHRITDTGWDEATLTYETRPPVDGPGLSTLGPVATGNVVEFDLGTAITTDGTCTFAIDSASPNGASYKSAASVVGQKPILLVTVAAGPAPSVRIVQPPPAAGFFVGDPITLQGTATDMAGDDLSGSLSWRSDLQGDLGVGAAVSATLVQGDHIIVAAVTDRFGLTAEARIHLSVTPRPPANTQPLVAITAPLAGRAYTAGLPIQFSGGANDLEDGVLTARLVWTSDRDGTLGAGAGFTRTLSAGMHRITATVTDGGGLDGSAEALITVEAPTILQLVPGADAYVDSSSPSANFGGGSILSVDARRTAYLRFTVSGIGARQVVQATLRLQADASPAAASPVGGTLHTISNGTWGERTVTFKTRPAVDGPAFGSVGAVKPGQVVEFDLTGGVTADGIYNLTLVGSSTDNADYRSRETPTPPKLVLALSGNAPVVAITAPPNQAVFPLGAAI
ncbi:MAG: DNRLRE domain-containing protein, partial [Deltaproteobacteria bacterium]